MNLQTRSICRPLRDSEGYLIAVHVPATLAKLDHPSAGIPTAVEVNGLWFVPAPKFVAEGLDAVWKEAGK